MAVGLNKSQVNEMCEGLEKLERVDLLGIALNCILLVAQQDGICPPLKSDDPFKAFEWSQKAYGKMRLLPR